MYPICSRDADELALLERNAEDLLRIADALRGVTRLRDDVVTIGIKPERYRELVKALLEAAKDVS